ncbi:MAG: polyprenyl synthetase family protein [Tannerella sp.]|jgi:octaprenyl-diphosphate synthase|nr:polyprenyl synthetase family protein [Tannerella sp.]
MVDIHQIEKPVASLFDRFLSEYDRAFQSEIKTIRSAIETIRVSNGKHIRPLLLLLTAEACGKATPDSVEYAVLIELLHTVSLIHDDVVDETKQRRGLPSLNAVYDNRVAVLVGDYIFSETMMRATKLGDIQVVAILSFLCREMSEGEVKQLENQESIILSEPDYFQILEKKTASLLSGCTEIGAITGGADEKMQDTCKKFGQLLGCCFQIKDDIFDYFDNQLIGKPSGNDIREGKITLPLLYALISTPESEKARYVEMINNNDFTPENIAALIAFAKAKGGIEYAQARMKEYKEKAIEIIETLPPSEAKDSLILLADYLVDRSK